MVSNKINQLQLTMPKDWSGLTTKNHIGAMWGEQPIITSNLISNIFDVNLALDIERFMDQFPTMEIERDAPFEWFLNNASLYRTVPLVNYYTDVNLSAQGTTPGIGHSKFYLEFPDRLFEYSDVIGYGYTEKETYQMRVDDEPRPNGTNWVYTVSLVTGDSNLYVPSTDLVAGVRFLKLYALAEQTLSQRGTSSVTFTSPFKMQNRLSFMRAEYMVPGNMIDQKENEPLGFFFIDADGKRHTTWINKLDYDFLVQFKRMKNLGILYGKSNKNSQNTYQMKGTSGYEIRTGSGLLEQIAPSNIHYYNTFNIDVLSDIMMSLSVGKLPEDQRRFVLGTGEYGMRQFHKAVETKAVTFAPSREEIRIGGSLNNMSYGGQFKKYSFLNGIEIELMYLPFLDDPSLGSPMHPDGGLVSSYEYMILDFGTSNGKPNIQKVTAKNANDIFRYIPGLRDPFSPGGLKASSGPSMTVSPLDGYQVLRATTFGVKVHNPMRIARFIPQLA
jgi:hypothetical protein